MSPGATDIGEDGGKLLIVECTHGGHQEFALQAIQHDPGEQVFTSEHPLGISQWRGKPRHAAAVGLVTEGTMDQVSLSATWRHPLFESGFGASEQPVAVSNGCHLQQPRKSREVSVADLRRVVCLPVGIVTLAA